MQDPLLLITPWIVPAIKIGMYAWLIVYLMFAVVIARQIELMIASFKTSHERFIRLIAYLHLGLVLFLLVVVFVL